jgi:hypothetical protein
MSLKLEFSKAADYDRINALFDPAIKQKVDPQGFVVLRTEEAFRKAAADGSVCMLTDQADEIQTITIAYRTFIDPAPTAGQRHEYTEIGTGLSRVPGYNSAQLIMAALAIHEWWSAAPKQAMVNEIDNGNAPSVKTYRDTLKWEEIRNQQEISLLFDLTYRNVAQDMGAGTGKPPPAAKRANETFYYFTDAALAVHVRILLEFIKQGGLLNKKTGHTIPVDFSALDYAGLTRPRLDAISNGVVDRIQLAAI